MSEIILIRPGSTDFDDQQRLQGTLNLPLNDRGNEQVAGLAEYLSAKNIEVMFVAPFEPALGTAKALQDALGIKVKIADEWRNLELGLWQGLSVEELQRKYPKAFKQWTDAPETICPPEGETVTEGLERIEKVLRKAIRKRDRFAIVAPEPFATLIRGALLCERPSLPDCVCRKNSEAGAPGMVEIIRCHELGQPGECEPSTGEMMNSDAFATIAKRGEAS